MKKDGAKRALVAVSAASLRVRLLGSLADRPDLSSWIRGERQSLKPGHGDRNQPGKRRIRADHFVPGLGLRIGDDLRLAGKEVREHAHVVGMVGDHQEVSWARQLCGWPLDAMISSPRAKR